MTILFKCTAEFSLNTMKWSKVSSEELGPGGDIIRGGENRTTIYYIGGIDFPTGNKSKSIYEYNRNSGWYKWDKELPVETEARPAWAVMEVAPGFCRTEQNITKSTSFRQAWSFSADSTDHIQNCEEVNVGPCDFVGYVG